jgi:hypothetical protein
MKMSKMVEIDEAKLKAMEITLGILTAQAKLDMNWLKSQLELNESIVRLKQENLIKGETDEKTIHSDDHKT